MYVCMYNIVGMYSSFKQLSTILGYSLKKVNDKHGALQLLQLLLSSHFILSLSIYI